MLPSTIPTSRSNAAGTVSSARSRRRSSSCRCDVDGYQYQTGIRNGAVDLYMSMDALGLSLWFQYLTLLFAVMATVILTPMVITVFRSSVSRSMARAAAEDVGAADVVHRAGSGVTGGA